MKRYLALLLALAMLCCLLAGCGSSEDTAAAAPEEAAASVEETPVEEAAPVEAATAEEPAPAEEAAPADESAPAPNVEAAEEAPGATGYDYTWAGPLDTPETVTMLSTEVNIMGDLGELGLTGFEMFDYYPVLVEKTNIELETRYMSFMTWSEQYQLFIAAGDWTDMVKGGDYTGGLEQGVEDEYLLDFTDYVQELMPNYYNRLVEYGYLEEATLNNRFLEVCSMYDEYKENQGLLIRQDWLDELGLDLPETWDDFHTVLKAFKDTYDCEWPIYLCQELTMTGFGGFDVPYQGGDATDITFFQEDGTVIASVTTQEEKEYISTLHQYWEDGILNPDFMTVMSDATSPNFNNTVSGGQLGLWPSSIEGLSTLLGMDLPEGFAVSALLGPHDSDDPINHNSSVTMTDNTSTIFTMEAEDNLEAVLTWMDFWYSDEGVLLHNYGVEGVDYVLDENGEPEFTDFVTENSYGLSASNFLRCRVPYGTLTGLDVRSRTAFEYNQQQLDAWDLWTGAVGEGECTIPSNATVSTDLNNEYTNLASDLATICNEWLTHFVLGTRDIDSEWDTFQQTLKDAGLDRVVEIRQISLDEYYARLNG